MLADRMASHGHDEWHMLERSVQLWSVPIRQAGSEVWPVEGHEPGGSVVRTLTDGAKRASPCTPERERSRKAPEQDPGTALS